MTQVIRRAWKWCGLSFVEVILGRNVLWSSYGPQRTIVDFKPWMCHQKDRGIVRTPFETWTRNFLFSGRQETGCWRIVALWNYRRACDTLRCWYPRISGFNCCMTTICTDRVGNSKRNTKPIETGGIKQDTSVKYICQCCGLGQSVKKQAFSEVQGVLKANEMHIDTAKTATKADFINEQCTERGLWAALQAMKK